MPFSPERTELIKSRLRQKLLTDGLNDWERSFLKNIEARFEASGTRTRLSDAQYRKLGALLKLEKEPTTTDGPSPQVTQSRDWAYRPVQRNRSAQPEQAKATYRHRKRSLSPLGVIYAPHRALRRAQRQIAWPVMLIFGLLAMVGSLMPSGSPETGNAPATSIVESGNGGSQNLYVTGSRVNQRTGPGTGNAVMGALNRGAAVRELRKEEGWTQIASSLGTGWMASRFLSERNPIETSPRVSAAVRGRAVQFSDIRVIDGDTVSIRGERANVRLVGFNTPETSKPACQAEAVAGRRATNRLREMLRGAKAIDYVRVACACRPGTQGTRSCNYGRECGSLYLDGVDVGRMLMAENLAVRYVCGRTSCPRRPGNWCG